MELTEEAKRSYEEFNQFLREFQDVYDAAALKLGISQSAFDVLWALCECGEGCLQRDICAYAYLGKQTVGSSVHKLVADGILHLEPAETGRGMRVFFTPQGKKFVDENVMPLLQADVEAFIDIPPDEREVLVGATQRYLRGLKGRFDAFEPTMQCPSSTKAHPRTKDSGNKE